MRRALTAAVLAAAAFAGAACSGALATPATSRPGIALFTENASGKRVSGAFLGTRLHVVGLVTPFVADQQVVVTIARHGRRVLGRTLPIVALGDGRGRFMLDYRSPRPGALRITATHAATPAQGRLDAAPRTASVVVMHADPGTHGFAVWQLQKLLAGLRYSVAVSGFYDNATARAVLAYRKVSGLARDGIATAQVFRLLLRGHGRFHVRYPRHGRHFEADLTHQVLAEVDSGGRVRRIYELSSGKPSTPTVIGSFRIYSKTPGTNAKGMVDSNYFIGGYAIHGYADVPPYPASHGCLRIPVPDAPAVFAWSRLGEIVDVYYRGGGGSHRVHGNAGP